jgi:hypothetical protein
MNRELSLELATAPASALARIAAGINRRPKRLLGVLKVENEYVGYVAGDRFEIWERRQRAVHAVGTVRARRGGSQVEVRFFLPLRTRVLTALFFAAYAVVAVDLTIQSSRESVAFESVAVAAAGALALVAIFTVAALRQGSDLGRFVEKLFADVPRI